uniref:Uncharacterized protein n=1 Tax=Arundo donax TaxID=35708 RepID=A0A0A9CUX6_ARUDO
MGRAWRGIFISKGCVGATLRPARAAPPVIALAIRGVHLSGCIWTGIRPGTCGRWKEGQRGTRMWGLERAGWPGVGGNHGGDGEALCVHGHG